MFGVERRGARGLSTDARIAVVRALHGLGDMLCAVPALSALRRAHPRSHITLIGLPACQWLLERFGALVDSLLPFPGFPGIPEQPYSPHALAAFLARPERFDLAVQMHGSGTVSNAFTALLDARAVAGLYQPGHYRPDAAMFFPYPDNGPEVHRWLFLTESLCCPSVDDRLTFPVSASDRAALNAISELSALPPGSFVCLHAGARDAARRWPAERFAAVADHLAERGYSIVLTGTASERAAADTVARAVRYPVINAAGQTSLGAVAALLERAALLVTNDTGISHLAASLRTPSVVVFLASDPERWAPIDRSRHRCVIARRLPTGGLQPMRGSSDAVPAADDVLAEALALLSSGYDR